jgi:hypothetical protein
VHWVKGELVPYYREQRTMTLIGVIWGGVPDTLKVAAGACDSKIVAHKDRD